MESLERIKKLRRNANSIKGLFNVRMPKWAADTHHYDKTGSGFNTDDRFKACESFPVFFSSHMGTYGDSGCSTQCELDKEIFQNHFIKYLNKNTKQIMLSIAESIENEAKTLKEKAESELNAEMSKLKELDD